MNIDKLCEAYSNGNNEELCKELRSFHHLLITQVQRFGPAAVMLQLHGFGFLLGILNKISAGADSGTVAERLALEAGTISAYLNYFQEVANRQEVDRVDALLSDSPDKNNLRMCILKTSLCHAGVGRDVLIRLATSVTKTGKGVVTSQISELLGIGLVEQIEVLKSPKARRGVKHYRITRLGEAILSRHLERHELALFLVDLAAFDEKMRDAMENEIRRTWPNEQ